MSRNRSYMPVATPDPEKLRSNLPVHMYDIPAVAAHQAMRGKIGKSVEALLKPENLTPSEMQGLTNRFLMHGKPVNPITKTMLDVATNPLMFIGLALWTGPYWKVTGQWMKKSGGVNSMLKFLKTQKNVHRGGGILGFSDSPMSTYDILHGKSILVKGETTRYWQDLIDDAAANQNIAGERIKSVMEGLGRSVRKMSGGKSLTTGEQAAIQLYIETKNTPVGKDSLMPLNRMAQEATKGLTRSLKVGRMDLGTLAQKMKAKNPALVDIAEEYAKANDKLVGVLRDAATDSKGRLDPEIFQVVSERLRGAGILMKMPTDKISPGDFQKMKFAFPRIVQAPTLDRTTADFMRRKDVPLEVQAMLKGTLTRTRAMEVSAQQPAFLDLGGLAELEKMGIAPTGMVQAINESHALRATNLRTAMDNAFKHIQKVHDTIGTKGSKFSELMSALAEKQGALLQVYSDGGDPSAARLAFVKVESALKKELSSEPLLRDALKEAGVFGLRGAKATEKGTFITLLDQFTRGAIVGGQRFEEFSKQSGHVLDRIAHMRTMPYTYNANPTDNIELFGRIAQPLYGSLKNNNITFLHKMADSSKAILESVRPGSYKALKTEILPMIEGRMHPAEARKRDAYRNRIFALHKWIKSSAGDVLEKIPGGKQIRTNLERTLANPESMITKGGWSQAGAGYMHLSTLGLNIGASHKNLMQVPMTVVPVTGAKAVWNGLVDMVKRGVAFNKELGRLKKANPGEHIDVLKNKAFEATFDDFHKAFGPQHVVDALAHGDIAKEGQIALNMVKGNWQNFKKVLMTPFGFSEKTNRLWSYYAFKDASVRSGHSAEDAMRVATFGVKATQFPGGVWGQPEILRGKNPLMKQFMHFPLRIVEWMRWTTRLKDDLDGPGLVTEPLGKLLVGSTVAYEAGKNLMDVDIAPGMLFQAMPIPTYEGAPFYPFPLVPPAVSIVGHGYRALQGREGQLGVMGGLLAPGGIAARRAYRTLSPKMADYGNRLPDGRIPIYNNDGQLISHQSPGQLIKRTLGIHTPSVQQEMQAVKYLSAQRDKIRDFRKKYMEAMLRNDFGDMEKINAEHKKAYPEIGDLQVSKRDVEGYSRNLDMTRFQRALRQMPRAYQGVFREAMTEAGGIEMSKYEGNDTGLQNEYLKMIDSQSQWPTSLFK